MKYICFIIIGLSTVSMAGFTRASDVVTDTITGLEWQDNNDNNISQWTGAIDYCENLTLNSMDWRLPNQHELLTLVEDISYNPSMNSTFINKQGGIYWSSTTSSSKHLNAWTVNFLGGSTDTVSKYSFANVRCVREVP